MSTKIEVNAMGDACPLPVVKTLKALKQLDGEGAVVTSVDNETAVKNISKMAQEKGCTASVEKISDAEWHVTVSTPVPWPLRTPSRTRRFLRTPAPARASSSFPSTPIAWAVATTSWATSS